MPHRPHRLAPLAPLAALATLALLAACERSTAPAPEAAARASAVQMTATYSVRSLGTLGGDFSLALGATGDIIVGVSSNSAGIEQAFEEWDGEMRPIGDGSEPSVAWAINNTHSIALSRGARGTERAILLVEGEERPLGSLGGAATIPLALNEAHDIVGWGNTSGGARHAFIWTWTGGMRDLGTLPGMISSEAFGVNVASRVIGVSRASGVSERAFQWTPRGGMRDLGTLGGTFAAAFAISDRGLIVGYAATTTEAQHAVIWKGSTKRDLGTLGGSYSAALAVNESDEVVGYSQTADGFTHAFVWKSSLGMIGLSPLPGGTFAVATAIQDNGRIAGYGDDASGALRALEWYR